MRAGPRLNTAVDPETPNCEGSLVVDKATRELMFSAAAPLLALLTGRSRLHVQGAELYGCRMADSRGVLHFRFEADGMRSETDA